MEKHGERFYLAGEAPATSAVSGLWGEFFGEVYFVPSQATAWHISGD